MSPKKFLFALGGLRVFSDPMLSVVELAVQYWRSYCKWEYSLQER